MANGAMRNSAILVGLLTLAAMAALLGVPFALRPPSARVVDPEQLVIISPHDEAVKEEFARAFSDWHQSRFGRPVHITWLNVGGGGDIRKYMESVFKGAFKQTLGGQPPKDMPWLDIDCPSTQPESEQLLQWRQQLADLNVRVDIYFGGGDYEQDQFKKLGWSVPIMLPAESDYLSVVPPSLGGVALYDTSGRCPKCRKWTHRIVTTRPECSTCRLPLELAHYWYGAVLTRVGIIYNNIVCEKLKLSADKRPRTWADLASPAFRGQLALADPNFSGSAKLCYEMVLQRHGWADGWRLLTGIAANARYFGSSSTQVALDVSRCEAAAGMIIDYYGRTQVDYVGPDSAGRPRLAYISPVGATATTADPISVLRGAPNRKVAERFVQFVLSKEGQKLWMGKIGSPGGPQKFALYRPPIRPDTYCYFDRFMIFDENPYEDAGMFNIDGQILGRRFGILGPLMRAAFIDNADLLKAAADRALRARPGSPAWAEFDAPPFDEAGMWAWADRYKAAGNNEPEKEKIASELTDLFRREYQRVLDAPSD